MKWRIYLYIINVFSKWFVFLRYVVSKNPEQIVIVAYLHVILFRMHEKDMAAEIKFDITI